MDIKSLSDSEQSYVMDILAGRKKLKVQTLDKSVSDNAKKYLAKVYGERETLTVAECSVWLGRTFGTIYDYINNGKVIAYRFGGDLGNYTIDVKKTKKALGIS